jgi:hypothetical protein
MTDERLDLAVERALILSATGALTPHAKDCISKTIDNYENEIRQRNPPIA